MKSVKCITQMLSNNFADDSTIPTKQIHTTARSVSFFKAKDAIRDWTVTGVQTCALPIWLSLRSDASVHRCRPAEPAREPHLQAAPRHHLPRRLCQLLHAAGAGDRGAEQYRTHLHLS